MEESYNHRRIERHRDRARKRNRKWLRKRRKLKVYAKKLTGESKLPLSAPFFVLTAFGTTPRAGSKECAEFNHILVICKSRGKCREEN
jgi:hypothetical protein